MNLTFLGLCLACFGVSLAEGLMMSNLFKSASRQPEIIGQLRSLLILGVAKAFKYSLMPRRRIPST